MYPKVPKRKACLTRWLSVAEQQVHIRTQEGVGGGRRARGGRAWSHCQSFPAQSLEIHFARQLCNKQTSMGPMELTEELQNLIGYYWAHLTDKIITLGYTMIQK